MFPLARSRTLWLLVLVLAPRAARSDVFMLNTSGDTVAVNPTVSALDANNKISLRSAVQRANARAGAD